MASLMEELVAVLEAEDKEYLVLTEIAKEKTPVIVAGKIEELQKVTEREQEIVARIQQLEKKRTQVMKDISDVLGKQDEELTLSGLVKMFSNKPEEQKKLSAVYDKLVSTVKSMDVVNKRNQALLEQALELVEFDINLYHSLKRAPENANYGRDAYSVADKRDGLASFDAKQ